MGLELCNGAGERALLWELLNVLFKRIARGVAMLDSLFFWVVRDLVLLVCC